MGILLIFICTLFFRYQCTVCDRWYFTSTSLRRHASVHSHHKEFKSNLSDNATTMQHDVNQHVNQNHNNRNDEEEFDYTKEKGKKKYFKTNCSILVF